jgi:hypoxia up-regulated 1
VLATHFAQEIDKRPERKGQESITGNKRAMMKLLKESNTLKEVLSANKESQFSVEALLEGEDFRSKITREQFEQSASSIWARLTEVVDKVLKRANKTIAEIDEIELIGGGVRVPKV